MSKIKRKVIRTATAWKSIGHEGVDGEFRIKGGRAIYDTVFPPHGCNVRLGILKHIENGKNDGLGQFREVYRYVAPDTILEFFKKDKE